MEIIKSYIARTLTFNNVVIFTHWCQIHIWFGNSRCRWHWCRFYFLRQNRNFISWLDIVLLHFATRFFQNLEICVKNYKFLQNLTKMCIFSLSCLLYNGTTGTVLYSRRFAFRMKLFSIICSIIVNNQTSKICWLRKD